MKENIFEINNLNNLKQNNFCFEMKNFYKNPNAVCELLNSKSPYIHKWGEKNSPLSAAFKKPRKFRRLQRRALVIYVE